MRRLAALLVLVLSAGTVTAGEVVLAVVVHPSRRETLTAAELGRIYLRKRRFWNDGVPIVPLNREAGSPARELFSVRVLGGESARLASYWNEAYFQGVFPPTVLSSSAAVKRYVASEPRAIGYVDPADVDDSVHVVLILDDGVEPAR
jgi:ABC-type phosphate transport system substrate-binding protein